MTAVRLSTRVGCPMPFDSRSNPTGKLRPEIELAWRRAELFGLDPGMDVRAAAADFDKHIRLSVAAGPVLDKMVDELADTRFAILLADRTSRIIDRRASSAAVECALDRILAIPGFQYLEELSGTKSLATAFELRQPIAVTGEEHFLEVLRPSAATACPSSTRSPVASKASSMCPAPRRGGNNGHFDFPASADHGWSSWSAQLAAMSSDVVASIKEAPPNRTSIPWDRGSRCESPALPAARRRSNPWTQLRLRRPLADDAAIRSPNGTPEPSRPQGRIRHPR